MKRIASFLSIVMIFALLCTGCDPYYGKYPWNKAQKWYCSEIDMTIEYAMKRDGSLAEICDAELEWNGCTYTIAVEFMASNIEFSIITEENMNAPISEDDTILKGTWFYRDGNMVITDFDEAFWEGKYSELVFVPQ